MYGAPIRNYTDALWRLGSGGNHPNVKQIMKVFALSNMAEQTIVRDILATFMKDCCICYDQLVKEFRLRELKNTKGVRQRAHALESLVSKCCEIIAFDPILMLTAATKPEIPEHLWEVILKKVREIWFNDLLKTKLI